MKSNAKIEDQNRASTTKKKKRYNCEFCDRSYKYDTGYYKHVKNCISKDKVINNKLLNMVVECHKDQRELCNEIIKLKGENKIIKLLDFLY